MVYPDVNELTQVMGRPTNNSISISVLSPNDMEFCFRYGTSSGNLDNVTNNYLVYKNIPLEIRINGLEPNTRYYCKLCSDEYASAEYSFHTQRLTDTTFVFAIQADSHQESRGMFDSNLYRINMGNVKIGNPDFYISLGDDFSLTRLGIDDKLSEENVKKTYINQRNFLNSDSVSAPIFLVNGNHDHASKYLLNDSPNNPAVWAAKSRNDYFPQPTIESDNFYTGNVEPVKHIGALNDYYAWTWGDALFITLDPYWHSNISVDKELLGVSKFNLPNKSPRMRSIWDITHGEAQYRWLEKTLKESKAKYKFVFTHHILGTGRGGIESADLGEWGGRNSKGDWNFNKMRPGWDLPIHQLMVKYNVSAFFQGHDHLFVHQVKDGIVYQTVPIPADPNYGVHNKHTSWRAKTYTSGNILESSGHLRVTVSPESCTVEYIRAWKPDRLNDSCKQGEIAFSYDINPSC